MFAIAAEVVNRHHAAHAFAVNYSSDPENLLIHGDAVRIGFGANRTSDPFKQRFARHRSAWLAIARVGGNGTNENLMVFKANTSRFTEWAAAIQDWFVTP